MVEKSYGQLLSLCALKGWLGNADARAALVRPEITEAFIQDHAARGISSVTIHMRVERILRMAQILDPTLDLEWLREIALDLMDQAHPRSKSHKIVDSTRLTWNGKVYQKISLHWWSPRLGRQREARCRLCPADQSVEPLLGVLATKLPLAQTQLVDP